ncbi:hypothetical protein RB195_018660 [Necator americanus]|uniref:Uncharacterized protein n=1 Tax=Necator americanus TaxID=51031 RepID=A0ABR1CAR2_NECAM
MDPASRKSRRSSILRIRQPEKVAETTSVENEQKQVLKRRVSFHNVKTVQNFDKDQLNLLDGSPFNEKIHETMSSDGVLTPARAQLMFSTPNTAVLMENSISEENNTGIFGRDSNPRLSCKEVTNYSQCDMLLCDTIGTMLDADSNILPEDRSSVDMSISGTITEGGSSDDTLAALEVMDGHRTIEVPVSGFSTKLEPHVSKRETTMDETMMVLSVKSAPVMSMLSIKSHEKAMILLQSSFDEDTALVFKDITTIHTRKSFQDGYMELSPTMSETGICGDTMAVFDTVVHDELSVEKPTSDRQTRVENMKFHEAEMRGMTLFGDLS